MNAALDQANIKHVTSPYTAETRFYLVPRLIERKFKGNMRNQGIKHQFEVIKTFRAFFFTSTLRHHVRPVTKKYFLLLVSTIQISIMGKKF